jgi:hypothetical protein
MAAQAKESSAQKLYDQLKEVNSLLKHTNTRVEALEQKSVHIENQLDKLIEVCSKNTTEDNQKKVTELLETLRMSMVELTSRLDFAKTVSSVVPEGKIDLIVEKKSTVVPAATNTKKAEPKAKTTKVVKDNTLPLFKKYYNANMDAVKRLIPEELVRECTNLAEIKAKKAGQPRRNAEAEWFLNKVAPNIKEKLINLSTPPSSSSAPPPSAKDDKEEDKEKEEDDEEEEEY